MTTKTSTFDLHVEYSVYVESERPSSSGPGFREASVEFLRAWVEWSGADIEVPLDGMELDELREKLEREALEDSR